MLTTISWRKCILPDFDILLIFIYSSDAPEATGEEGEDADLEAPKVYEPIPSYEAT